MSELRDALALAATEELSAPSEVPPGPWPTDFEIEMRRELADLKAHLLRSDRLIMDLQLEVRRAAKRHDTTALRIESKIDDLVTLIRKGGGNGHD